MPITKLVSFNCIATLEIFMLILIQGSSKKNDLPLI